MGVGDLSIVVKLIRDCENLKKLCHILNEYIGFMDDNEGEEEDQLVLFEEIFSNWYNFPTFNKIKFIFPDKKDKSIKQKKQDNKVYSLDDEYFMFFDNVNYKFYLQER